MRTVETREGLDILDKIIKLHRKKNLPMYHVFYETQDTKRTKFDWLKNLGSSGVSGIKFPLGEDFDENPNADIFQYGRMRFYIVNVDELPR